MLLCFSRCSSLPHQPGEVSILNAPSLARITKSGMRKTIFTTEEEIVGEIYELCRAYGSVFYHLLHASLTFLCCVALCWRDMEIETLLFSRTNFDGECKLESRNEKSLSVFRKGDFDSSGEMFRKMITKEMEKFSF